MLTNSLTLLLVPQLAMTYGAHCTALHTQQVYDAVGNLRASGKGFDRFCSAVGHREKEYGIENNIMLLGEEATGGNGEENVKLPCYSI
jgi:hypothetical protein